MGENRIGLDDSFSGPRHAKAAGEGRGGDMKRKLAKFIADAFDLAIQEFGDEKSTEFLVQIVADRLDIEPGDVYEALAIMAGAE